MKNQSFEDQLGGRSDFQKTESKFPNRKTDHEEAIKIRFCDFKGWGKLRARFNMKIEEN